MHISEGVLSPGVLLTGGVLTCIGTAIGLRSLNYDRLMTVGLLSSAFFVASLVHLPIGVSSVHLLGNGLLGVLLGWGAFPAILVALLLQAILFQYGGLTVLGVNTLNMALGGVCAWYLFRLLLRWRGNKKTLYLAAFIGGFSGVAFAAVFCALALAFTDEGFKTAAVLLLTAHVPVMLAEGLITMFTIVFIAQVRPEILNLSKGTLSC